MNTKYQELKNQIKANAELTRILKNHRKTVHIQGERLKDFKIEGEYSNWENGKRVTLKKEFTLPVLEASMARDVLDGWGRISDKDEKTGRTYNYVIKNPSYENSYLFEVYGILRNERKTKKIKVWEDIVNSKTYPGSWLQKQVDSWRDEETVCTGK